MNDKLNVWLDNKEHSVEGHTMECTLKFKGKVIWGPTSCHDNTIALREAIHDADDRFDMSFTKKDKTGEGHTRYISVKSNDKVVLDKLSTHDDMAGLVNAIKVTLIVVD
ncbi:hypothetical protein CMQ_6502 [Grosmannia clavigera kw1407]|uniref:Uncharacterized protein n=1 Tax=Grosmannia clavigera (strain kw1407 / UAMH 11150) TaxID=655863 RepID=F0X7M4_GROCL|nr:uncharacterized protein CMQ_6502 [Grosmannia clavigera kw1407]EFX06181.1 hypothetical protein CMQ_6502 [Grosmannia clavigera kw1407]